MRLTLDDFKVFVEFPVHWGDMDAADHVNNLIYLRWAESSRIRFFEEVGIATAFKPGNIAPILGWQDCKYIFPITYPDKAIVGIRAFELLEDRVILESAVFSEKHNRLAAISKQHIIPYNYSELKKVPLPEHWVEAIWKNMNFQK
ncbi:MAG: thioesterase family protein [Bacteroidota bacterium]